MEEEEEGGAEEEEEEEGEGGEGGGRKRRTRRRRRRTRRRTYQSLDTLAGISLMRPTLVPKIPSTNKDLVNHTDPFLYKLVGSIGFSPNPQVWKDFLSWLKTIDIDTFPAEVPGLVTTEWYKSLDKRTMWTQLFIYFCEQRGLYTLYSYHNNKETMASHWRERGTHFKDLVFYSKFSKCVFKKILLTKQSNEIIN